MYGVTFPGIHITKLDMVHCTGAEPSVCYCTIIPAEPEDTDLSQDGTLSFYYEGSELFSFHHCKIRNLYARAATSLNALEAEVEIVDRRHRWSQYTVGGRYNVLTNAEGSIRYATLFKTWTELFEIIFQAMDEEPGSYSINLPDDQLPPPVIEWDDIPCNEALQDLADKAQCEICLTNDDVILIEAKGEGPELPTDGARTPKLNLVTYETSPDVEVEFGPTRYEGWLRCKAAAIDSSGMVTTLGEAGWMDNYWDFLAYNVPGSYPSKPVGVKSDSYSLRAFAKQKHMLFRMYTVSNLLWSLPDYPRNFSASSILPLHARNIYDVTPQDDPATPWPRDYEQEGPDRFRVPQFDNTPPHVYAYYMVYGFGLKWTPGMQWGYWEEHDKPRIDRHRGLIFFDRYLAKIGESDYSRPPYVYMKATFNVRDYNGNYLRYRYSEGSPSSRKKVIKYHDVSLYHVQIPGTDSTYNNKKVLEEELGPSLVSRYSVSRINANWMEWNGVRDISLRGNVTQVRWVLSPLRVYTQSGENLKHPVLAPVSGDD